MSMTLRDYITACLPAPVEESRLAAFFEQPDVVACLAQIGPLTDRIIANWQPEPSAIPVASAVVQPSLTRPSPSNNAGLKLTYSFRAGTVTGSAPLLAPFTFTRPLLATEPSPTAPSTASAPNPPDSGPTPNPDATLTDSVRFTSDNPAGPPAPQPLRTIPIPNATVGKPYTFTLDFGALGVPELAEHTLSVDPATGLTYDPVAQTISGTPVADGEFSFGLTYRLKTDEPTRPALSRRIQLLVNPDPRSLWKDLPSDGTDPYYKPDADNRMLAVGDVRLLAASVRGRSHAHEGKFRDDDFSLTHFPETGWYLLTVADGAGSARYARKGAQLACERVTQYLQGLVEPAVWRVLDTVVTQYASDQREPVAGTVHRQLYDVLGKAVFDAYKTIETEAQTNGAALKDYSTTLITVLTKPVAGGWFVGAFWVGDGGVGIYHPDREPIVLGVPDGGEYAGQTRFLTMPDTIANNFFGRFRFAFVPDFTAIILMTDGVTDPKFQTDSNLGRQEKWAELWADLNQGVSLRDDALAPTQLQNWLTFWSPGNHDDRTIALLYTHAGNEKN